MKTILEFERLAREGWEKERKEKMAAAPRLSEVQERAIKHALTAGRGFVYRNHYVCEYGTPIYEEIMDLCEIGFARQVISPFPEIEQTAFIITRKGAHAVGLHLPGEERCKPIIKKGAEIPPGELEPGKVQVLEDDYEVGLHLPGEKPRIDPEKEKEAERIAKRAGVVSEKTGSYTVDTRTFLSEEREPAPCETAFEFKVIEVLKKHGRW